MSIPLDPAASLSAPQEQEVYDAKQNGFTPYYDDRRGTNWCKFNKENVWVWEGGGLNWIRCTLILDPRMGPCYTDHQKYRSLHDALTDTNGEAF